MDLKMDLDKDHYLLFSEIVGSTAYGLATEDSDIDRLGVFIVPTTTVLGLGWSDKKATIVGKDEIGDYAVHEVGKWLKLVLTGNPTVTEILFMDTLANLEPPGFHADNLEYYGYLTLTRLKGIRHSLLSTPAVMNAYSGYAMQQVKKLERRGDSFDSATRNRTAKHARHCMRLLLQGRQLLTTGELNVDCSEDRDFLFEMGELAVANLNRFLMGWSVLDNSMKMQAESSVLADKPDYAAANDFLIFIRGHYWEIP